MEEFYKTIGGSRQDYHQSILRSADKKDREHIAIKLIKKIRKSHPKMGSRTMFYSLKEQGIELQMGVNSFENMVSRNNLTVGRAMKSGPKTSDGKGKGNYRNLIDGIKINDVNRVLVGDITYFWVEDSWHYIFTLKDVYSQRLISLIPSKSMKVDNAVKSLQMLVNLRGEGNLKGCIHHSDNGSQYNAKVYTSMLSKLKMKISRAEICQQNGSAEQLNHIVKNMYLNHWGITTFKELEKGCKEVQYLMNEQRTVAQLGNVSPVKFEKILLTTPLDKRRVKKLHDFRTKK